MSYRAAGNSSTPGRPGIALEFLRRARVADAVVVAIGLVVVGGSFETVGMGGEIVLEVFVTDGKRIANLAGPAERQVVRDMLESVKQLASTLRFE